ncbi:MAG: class B sortase [Oscillospiraceae bacterium]|nr:class B sortase [Oscillospiraceae bacterium]
MTNQNNGKYLPRRPENQKGRKNSPVSRILLVVALVSALIFAGTVFIALRNQIALKRMAAETARETTPISTSAPAETTVPTQATVPPTTAATVPPTEPREVLPRLQEQYEKNPDLAGWLTIPGTRIDYPVMYSPDEPERYLHANFEVSYSFAGLPFIDAACDPESGNRIIYAHNMLDGSMFRTLLKYQQKDFWQRNPVISFSTLYEEQEYEVVAAFYDKVYKKSDTNFKFYQFYDTSDQSSFDEAMAYYREHALYDTGVTAQCGDLFLTLVTCAYQTENGRFVVVARKK